MHYVTSYLNRLLPPIQPTSDSGKLEEMLSNIPKMDLENPPSPIAEIASKDPTPEHDRDYHILPEIKRLAPLEQMDLFLAYLNIEFATLNEEFERAKFHYEKFVDKILNAKGPLSINSEKDLYPIDRFVGVYSRASSQSYYSILKELSRPYADDPKIQAILQEALAKESSYPKYYLCAKEAEDWAYKVAEIVDPARRIRERS